MMKRRKFGEYAMGGSVSDDFQFGAEADSTPPIMGAPMPDTGMQARGLGEVFPEKEDDTL